MRQRKTPGGGCESGEGRKEKSERGTEQASQGEARGKRGRSQAFTCEERPWTDVWAGEVRGESEGAWQAGGMECGMLGRLGGRRLGGRRAVGDGGDEVGGGAC